ncbi:MAG: hypothetical protein ACI89X_000945 [Planctomycetota bacterium]|jgi:hypothetical protein
MVDENRASNRALLGRGPTRTPAKGAPNQENPAPVASSLGAVAVLISACWTPSPPPPPRQIIGFPKGWRAVSAHPYVQPQKSAARLKTSIIKPLPAR